MEAWQIWLAVALIFIIIEMFTSGFAVACFSIGALFSMVASFFTKTLWIMCLAFAVGTALAFIFVRPLALKYLFKKKKEVKTGVDAIVGREGVVTERIEENGFGRVKIDGDDWKARSEDHKSVEVGEHVEIISVDSVIITIKRI